MIQHHHHQHEYGKSFLPPPHLLICLIFNIYESLSWLDTGQCAMPIQFLGAAALAAEWMEALFALHCLFAPDFQRQRQHSQSNFYLRSKSEYDWALQRKYFTKHLTTEWMEALFALGLFTLDFQSQRQYSSSNIRSAKQNMTIINLGNIWLNIWLHERTPYLLSNALPLCSRFQRPEILIQNPVRACKNRTWQCIAKKILETIDTNDRWKNPNFNPGW